MSFPLRRLWFVWPVLAAVLLWLLWDWNWFRPLAERRASAAMGRTVTAQNLAVDMGWHPRISLSGVTVANPDGFVRDAAPLATVQGLHLRIDLRALLDRRVALSELTLDTPTATLRDDKGQRNWVFTLPEPDEPPARPWVVEIAGLVIRDGRFSLQDAALKADIAATVATGEGREGSEAPLIAEAKGSLRGEAFTARFTGGSVLTLRTPENPYPVDLAVQAGQTRVVVKGTLLDPARLGGAKLALDWRGEDLAQLADLTRLPLPATPPYRLQGAVDFAGQSLRLRGLKGLLGESDLAGDIALRLATPRPRIEATLRSERVRLADLSGLIGADPNRPAAARTGGRLLPDTPINVPRLDNADAKIVFAANSIQGDKLPFDALAFTLTLDEGVMRVAPVDFGLGEGALRLFATLDPRGETLGLEVKAELKRVDVSTLMAKTGYRGSGRIGGEAALSGKGRSAAALLGGGDGHLKLAMAGGDFSALLLDLAGLDFGNAALSLLGLSPRTEVRCLVGDFSLKNGLVDTEAFVLDTGTTNVLLDGSASLRDETLDLELTTRPKRANIGRLKAPIHVTGRFSEPKVRPGYRELGLRGAAAVALGTLVTPLAALLPTLQLGPGEDQNCQALLAAADTVAPPQPQILQPGIGRRSLKPMNPRTVR